MSDVILSREQILNVNDLPQEKVAVPEWGGSVIVRMLSAEERGRLERMFPQGSSKENAAQFRCAVLALCIVGDDGNTIFSEADIDRLKGRSNRAVERVFVRACKLNGFTQKQVEELEKNSEADQSDDSSSS